MYSDVAVRDLPMPFIRGIVAAEDIPANKPVFTGPRSLLLSIHTIKSRSPPGTSLSDHFFAKFGRSGTPECTTAQRRFTESLAAYSLICYLLQIKDRHNGGSPGLAGPPLKSQPLLLHTGK